MTQYIPLVLAIAALADGSPVSVLTNSYENGRSNANLHETVLNQSNVNPASFGKLFSVAVQGYINAQPLYVPALAIPGKGTRNVVYVVTHHNDVYAFDADTGGPSLWHVNVGSSVSNADYNVGDLEEIGILSTPVIDPSTKTIYLVAHSKEDSNSLYRLHALDIRTGAQKFNGPSVIQGSAPGNYSRDSQDGRIPFVANVHLQRPGLLLMNGAVYVAFGSHNDAGIYRGWLFGYNANNVQQQVSVFVTAPDPYGAGIWQSGRGLAADERGNIFIATGNGPSDGATNWGQSILRISSAPILSVADWFTPDNYQHLNNIDSDLGSSGPVVTQSGYVIAGGKEGVVYLMDRDRLGHMQSTGQIRQAFPAIGFGIYNMAFWERPGGGVLYLRGSNDGVKAFRLADGRFESLPFTQTDFPAGLPFDGMAVSANGDDETSAIFWFTAIRERDSNGVAILHALSATDLTKELWSSEMDSRDTVGTLAKFTSPTIANGKVYVPSFANQLVVYGLKSAKQSIAVVVNAASGESGPIAPGEMVTIFGSGLGPDTPASFALEETGKLSSKVAATRMLFNGVPAPLIYAGSDQVTAIVPNTVAGLERVTIQPEYQGQSLPGLSVSTAETNPGLFTLDMSGQGPGAVVNEDGSVNSALDPARRGTIVMIFGTGQGLTDPPWDEDKLAEEPFPEPVNSVAVTIGGKTAEILYAGAAPGFAGLIQINARVPTDVPPGEAVPVLVTIGDDTSQAGVTIAVQ